MMKNDYVPYTEPAHNFAKLRTDSISWVENELTPWHDIGPLPSDRRSDTPRHYDFWTEDGHEEAREFTVDFRNDLLACNPDISIRALTTEAQRCRQARVLPRWRL